MYLTAPNKTGLQPMALATALGNEGVAAVIANFLDQTTAPSIPFVLRGAEQREEEEAMVRAVDVTSADESIGVWYIVSSNWLLRWKAYVVDDTAACPGPVDNLILLDDKGQLRTGLQKVLHYRGIVEETWNFLISMHGGGPIMTRRKIDIYDKPLVVDHTDDHFFELSP